MKVAVVGTGYVGLVTGTCLAEAGHAVTCIDIDEAKVKRMQQAKIPIYEPGLEELFAKNIAADTLRFTTDISDGIKNAEAIFLALPTPPGEDGSADLSYIINVADKLGSLLTAYTVIIDKSTVPVGTAEQVRSHISKTATVPFDVVSNPEFLREGHAVNDFQSPDRIVVGSSSDRAKAIMTELYHGFVDVTNPIIFMDERSAEITKYAANAFLAMKITFMNQIANLADATGANVDDIHLGIGSDARIGKQFLQAGIGYGGSCFPKDVTALEHIAKTHHSNFSLLSAVSTANQQQKQLLATKVQNYFSHNLQNKRLALWGLAFKPETDDIREAPSLTIIDNLIKAGAQVVAYDPEARDNVQRLYADNSQVTFATDKYEALDKAEALIIATEWSEFKTADLAVVKKMLRQPVVFDGRNIFDLSAAKEAGLYYESIGRPRVLKEDANV